MALVLEVQGLSKKIGDRAIVDNISINVKKGEIFGLLGPNGAGKNNDHSHVGGACETDNGSNCHLRP